ncbi:MAG: DUF1232 domain-containing protein [Candidatus Sericytochromatia bacterium]
MNLRRILMSAGGLLGLLYILNPGAGLFELLPDALPLVGNLDEALAVTLVLACLRDYGLDLTHWGKQKGLGMRGEGRGKDQDKDQV